MSAWYSKRAKRFLAHKFAEHPKAGPTEERLFGNYTGLFGHCHHMPPRYVYIRIKAEYLNTLTKEQVMAELEECGKPFHEVFKNGCINKKMK